MFNINFNKNIYLYSVLLAVFSILMTSANSLSLLRLYSHDTIHHYLSHLWFLQVLMSDHFPFWYSAPLASFPTSTLQLGQWFHSPYIYLLSFFETSYDYFDLRFEFLFWRMLSFLGFYLFSGHHLSTSITRVTAASLYIASGMVATTDPEILFLQAFAFIPWILFSVNLLSDYPLRGAALFALNVSFLIWFGYHGIGLVLPVFIVPSLLILLSTSHGIKSFTKRFCLLALSGMAILIMVSLKISDTLTVPIFGDQLGPSRSSFEGLLLPSQLLSLSLPNPTFFYSPQEPVSLQSLYVGIIPFLILLFILDFCIELLATKCFFVFNTYITIIRDVLIIFNFILLFLGCFKISFTILFLYITASRFAQHFGAVEIRAKSQYEVSRPKDILNLNLFRSLVNFFSLAQKSLILQVIIAFLTGIASPVVGFFQSLYPPMQIVRYQSNNLIFLVTGCIILSMFLLEYFIKYSHKFGDIFRFRERSIFVFHFVSIVALWLLLHINNYYNDYYNDRDIMISSIFSYALTSFFGFIVIFFAIKLLKLSLFNDYKNIFLLFIITTLSILLVFCSQSQVFFVPVFFRSIRDAGYISFIINFFHFFTFFIYIILVFCCIGLRKNSLNMWCLVCVLDISIASNLYEFQSEVIVGNPENISSAWSDISTPQIREGLERISISYYPQSLMPGMWTFNDVMPSSITFMKSHMSVAQNLVINIPQHCGSINTEQETSYLYSVIDVTFNSNCFTSFDNIADPSTNPVVQKWVGSRIVVSVFASEPSFLVFVDGWAPGWNATIDGHETPVLRGDKAVRVIRIPAGYSLVKSEYHPVGFWLIFPLSIIVFILCVITIVFTPSINGGLAIIPKHLLFGIETRSVSNRSRGSVGNRSRG